MIYVHWIFIVVYAIVIISIIVTVLLDNRQPAKTMAWVMVLMFVPVFGIVLYIFFGQNTRKMRLMSQRSLDQLSKRQMLEFVEQRELRLPESIDRLYNCLLTRAWHCLSKIMRWSFILMVTSSFLLCYRL